MFEPFVTTDAGFDELAHLLQHEGL
jgi:hypothetical protein